ncbi:hypothetical protein Q1695_013447 [Nippostrongylus brasiliensis]|nr:hypothetical protein Q1695_013447 [Nippostrongylus brasiliensis]
MMLLFHALSAFRYHLINADLRPALLISLFTDLSTMLRASRAIARPKSIERISQALSRSISREPIKGKYVTEA